MDELNKPQEIDQATLELGIAMGQRRALGMVAGRCSAAQAAMLLKMRDEKRYLKLAPTWEEYCARYLKISSRTANRNIVLFQKHGSLFFETAALTGISPAQYERIAPQIQADGIHAGGEVIALIPENTERVIEAVAKLQADAEAEASAAPAPAFQHKLRELERRGHQVAQAYRKLRKDADDHERAWLNGSVRKVTGDLERIEIGG
jgi:hypothetical protein